MNGTDSAKIHCPSCQKPILSQAALAEGTRFVLRCQGCGRYVRIIATFNAIHKRVLDELHEHRIIVAEASDSKPTA